MTHRDAQRRELLVGDARGREVGVRDHRAQRGHRRLAAQRLQIGADEAVRHRRHFVEGDVAGERHGARVDGEDLAPRLRIRHADLNLAIEPSGPPQRRVDRVGEVGRADDDHLPPRLESVHQRQQLRHDALLDLALQMLAPRDRVDPSMKTMQGAHLFACSKMPRSRASLSP